MNMLFLVYMEKEITLHIEIIKKREEMLIIKKKSKREY